MLQIAVAALYGVGAALLPPDLIILLFIPVAICVLILLWIMPDRQIFPLTMIEKFFGLTLFLMLFWPNYVAFVIPGLPWVTPTRLALFILTVLFLYSVSSSSPLRKHLVTIVGSSPTLWVSFVVWQIAMVTSLPFSNAIGDSIKGLVDNELRLTQMFFIGLLIFARAGMPTWTVRLILIMSLVSALEGFLELYLGYPFWAHSIPSFMRIDDSALEEILGSQARADDGIYRVRGPYVNSLVFSEYLAMCTPFIIHWFLTGRSVLVRASMAGLWAVVLAAIVVTQSRLGLVGTLVAIVTYVPMWAYRQWRSSPTSILGPALLFGAPLMALAFIGVIFSSHTLTARVLGGGAQASSDEARTIQRTMAIPKIEARPLGHGINQGAVALGFTLPSGKLTVDNYYLNSLLDIGIFGAIGFYGMFAAAAAFSALTYLRTEDNETKLAGPLAVVCINFLVLKSVLSEEHNHSLFFLLMGMAVTISARERKLFRVENTFPKTYTIIRK